MPSESYKGKTIEIINNELVIDGKKIDIIVDSSGKYSSHRFPYSSFSNPSDLAKAIIENSGEE